MQTYEDILRQYIRRGVELGAQHLAQGETTLARADARNTLWLARILARREAREKEFNDAHSEALRDEAQAKA